MMNCSPPAERRLNSGWGLSMPTENSLDQSLVSSASDEMRQSLHSPSGNVHASDPAPPEGKAAIRPFEQELIQALKLIGEGQWQVWSRVVGLVGPRSLRYARFLTEHDADAEDVVQQSLTRLAASPALFRVVQHPWAYFLKIVRNEAIRFRMKHQRPSSISVNLLTELQFRSAIAIDPLEVAERQQMIQAALTELPVDQAEVVILKFWEGMTFQEIASVMGESPNTVASRYRYAIAKLARLLRSLEGEAAHVS